MSITRYTPHAALELTRARIPAPALRLALALLTCTTPVAIGLASPASAIAGEWALVSCAQPSGQPAPVDGWQSGGAGTDKGSLDTCGAPGGALIAQVLDSTEQPAYQPATWTFTAPGGSTIAGGSLSLGFFTPEGQDYAETPQNVYDSADMIANCQYNTGSCGTQWITETSSIQGKQTGGTQIFLGAECVAPVEGHAYCQQPGDPQFGASGLDAQTNLYAATIELQDDATPAGSGFSGGLLNPAGAGGVQSLLFTAAEPSGPGILRVSAAVDGKTVYDQTPDTNAGECQSIGNDANGVPEYLYEQPCKVSEVVDVPVDTTSFSNGEHHLTVTVVDAAGNTATVFDGTITTSNVPAPIPNGRPCAGAHLSVDVNGKTKAKVKVRYNRRVTITGFLHCGTTPIPGAEVAIVGGSIGADTETQANGSFAYGVPKGPSRTLTLSYTPYSNDIAPTATAREAILVYPTIRLTIRPRHTHNGGTMTWHGVIDGGPYPSDGVSLLAEARAGRHWETFAQILAPLNGRYGYRYTFTRTFQPTLYKFRVVLPESGSAGYEYLPSASNVVRVHVT